MEYLASCPICNQSNFSSYLSCKDHTVSGEVFTLEKCLACDFVFTNPRPAPGELDKYYLSNEYISHSNKAKGFINAAYKVARTFTLKWKYRLVQNHTIGQPKSILDYGCGTGSFLQECKKNGLSVTGVEPFEPARREAERLTQTKIAPNADDVHGYFDAVTLWHVLEHVYDLREKIEWLTTRLLDHGTIFLAVPNLESADAKKYGEHWAGFDVPRHLWHFSQSSMTKLLANHRLKVTGIVPMPLDAYYVSVLSEKYSKGDNGIIAMARAVLEGATSNRQARTSGEYSSLIYIVRK